MVPSAPAETRRGSPVLVVVTASARTGPTWPVSGLPWVVPVRGFQSKTVMSSREGAPAEARRGSPVLVVVTVSAHTQPVWPVGGWPWGAPV